MNEKISDKMKVPKAIVVKRSLRVFTFWYANTATAVRNDAKPIPLMCNNMWKSSNCWKM